jgi:hypothetical protein
MQFNISASWVEVLFWLPTLTDLSLLVMIYGSCSYHGVMWYLRQATQDKKSEEIITKDSLSPTVHQVWEFGMMAYSAYAVLLPLALYWCIVLPQVRPSFCWAMTTLMAIKVRFLLSQETKRKSGKAAAGLEQQNKEKLASLYFFYFPTYGGYAIIKTFLM